MLSPIPASAVCVSTKRSLLALSVDLILPIQLYPSLAAVMPLLTSIIARLLILEP
jgi:hypothetical protein